jgi:hypothetical protein
VQIVNLLVHKKYPQFWIAGPTYTSEIQTSTQMVDSGRHSLRQ